MHHAIRLSGCFQQFTSLPLVYCDQSVCCMLTITPSAVVPLQLSSALVAAGDDIKRLVASDAAATASMTPDEVLQQLPRPAATAAPSASSSESFGAMVVRRIQLVASLASLYYADLAIKQQLTQVTLQDDEGVCRSKCQN